MCKGEKDLLSVGRIAGKRIGIRSKDSAALQCSLVASIDKVGASMQRQGLEW